MSTTIRPTGSTDTHRIWGEAPGWAHCATCIDDMCDHLDLGDDMDLAAE